MDRLYFDVLDRAHDIAMYAAALVRNANYREDVELRTRPYLRFLYNELEKTKQVIQEQVMRQMKDDPTERDIDLKQVLQPKQP